MFFNKIALGYNGTEISNTRVSIDRLKFLFDGGDTTYWYFHYQDDITWTASSDWGSVNQILLFWDSGTTVTLLYAVNLGQTRYIYAGDQIILKGTNFKIKLPKS
jgi:hypothetical protein